MSDCAAMSAGMGANCGVSTTVRRVIRPMLGQRAPISLEAVGPFEANDW